MDKVEDLRPEAGPVVTWDPTDPAASLDAAYAAVRARGVAAHTWYEEHRLGKAQVSKVLRGVTAAMFGAAAVFPAVAVADPDVAVAAWGYVPIAVGAGVYGIDKVFGFSAAWMRYMVTASRIRSRLEVADLEWATRRAAMTGDDPADEAAQAFSYLTGLTAEIHRMVEAETEQWATEVGSTLAALQSAADAAKR